MVYPILCLVVAGLVFFLFAVIGKLQERMNAYARADEADAETVDEENEAESDDDAASNGPLKHLSEPAPMDDGLRAILEDPAWQGHTIMTITGKIIAVHEGFMTQYRFGKWEEDLSAPPSPEDLRMGLDLTGFELPRDEEKVAQLAYAYLSDYYRGRKTESLRLALKWSDDPTLHSMQEAAYWLAM